MGIQTSRTKTVFIDAARLGSAVPAFVRNHLTELAGGPGKHIRVTDDVDIYAHVSRTGSVLNLDLIRL